MAGNTPYMTPIRISHLPRRDGPLPDGVRYVGRPSRWGNPYWVHDWGRAAAVELYDNWIDHRIADDPKFLDPLRTATGLACACPLNELCHADILINHLTEAAAR